MRTNFHKKLKFLIKIENRQILVNFENKNPDLQLYQICKPIGKIFCTFLPI